MLYAEVAKNGVAKGYVGGELGWTLEDNAQINRGMTLPEVRKRMDDIGVEIVSQTPEQFLATMRRDTATWEKLIRDFNIQVE